MNIVELCLSPSHGGMELYMARCTIELAKRHRVLPIVPPDATVVPRLLADAGLPWREWEVGLKELPLRAAWRFARLLDSEGVDVVHAHWRGDLPLAAFAKAFSRRRPRLVYTSQMKISHTKRDPYHTFIYGQVDTLLTITDQLREQIRGRLHPRLQERVRRLYYGAEAAQALTPEAEAELRGEHDLPPGPFTVGLFGQKHEGKGQHLLLEALARLNAEGLPCRALVVGPVADAAYVSRLRERIAELGLAEQVRLLDFTPHPQALMQLCDVVVLATYQETFGLVLIEAMRVGVPVIGSDAGGVPEIITDGETGLLFETRNADSLHARLAQLHRDPALRKRLAEAGRARAAERFGIERHYRELEAVLRGE